MKEEGVTTTMPQADYYTAFRNASETNRRLLDQEEFILDVTERIAQEMESQEILQKDLAQRLGKSKGYVSQLLGGDRNLTLRTIADIASALNCRPTFTLRRVSPMKGRILEFPARGDGWPDVTFTGPGLEVEKPIEVCC